MDGDLKGTRKTRRTSSEKRRKVCYSSGIRVGLNSVWTYFGGLADSKYIYIRCRVSHICLYQWTCESMKDEKIGRSGTGEE